MERGPLGKKETVMQSRTGRHSTGRHTVQAGQTGCKGTVGGKPQQAENRHPVRYHLGVNIEKKEFMEACQHWNLISLEKLNDPKRLKRISFQSTTSRSLTRRQAMRLPETQMQHGLGKFWRRSYEILSL